MMEYLWKRKIRQFRIVHKGVQNINVSHRRSRNTDNSHPQMHILFLPDGRFGVKTRLVVYSGLTERTAAYSAYTESTILA